MTDAQSPRYTHGHHEAVLRSHRWRTAENSAAYLLPHLAPGLSILDVGCGPGTITLDFANRVAPGRVIGVDAAPAAIEAATAESQGADNVEFRTADLYALDFADDTFDIVHAHQVLQHLEDPVAALREMRRVCKPGGIVAARDGDYAAFTWYPAVDAMSAWQRMYDVVARANKGEPNAGRFLLAWAHAAGFAPGDVQPGASTWCYATPEDRTWWGELWADRITQSAIAAQAVEIGAATEAELQEMAAAWRQWATEPDGWFAVLHGEILCRA